MRNGFGIEYRAERRSDLQFEGAANRGLLSQFRRSGASDTRHPGECFLSGRDDFLRHGRRVSTPPRLWLGVWSYTLREHVVIAGVMPGSPGEKAGLRQGDLVLSADGLDIHERKAFYDAIRPPSPGREGVQLRIMRNNQVQNLEIAAIIRR